MGKSWTTNKVGSPAACAISHAGQRDDSDVALDEPSARQDGGTTIRRSRDEVRGDLPQKHSARAKAD